MIIKLLLVWSQMAERVPILHIVGAPCLKLQSAKALLHHTLGDGSFTPFSQMSASVSAVAPVMLTSVDGAATIIDDLLLVALRDRRPVYLALPRCAN